MHKTRRIFGVLLLLAILTATGIYVFIPATLRLSSVVYTRCNDKSAGRYLDDSTHWSDLTGPLRRPLAGLLEVPWRGYPTTLLLIPGSRDSLVLQWSARLSSGWTPWARILRYREALALKDRMKRTLTDLGSRLSDPGNLYSVPIQQVISPDSNLIVIRDTLGHEPTTVETYALIHRLESYAMACGARITDYPMRHVQRLGAGAYGRPGAGPYGGLGANQGKGINQVAGSYALMVALPTDKMLPGREEIEYKHFVPWRTIEAKTVGGDHAVDEAYRQLQLYLFEHQRVAMATPFESLITDRSTEPDSAKWITLVCQPVS